MIKIGNIETYGWEAAIRGMRNPMNSWEKSDSSICNYSSLYEYCSDCPHIHCGCTGDDIDIGTRYLIGPNDLSLILKLAKAGSDHAKYRRMITVTMDILAPLYWWKEFDTYKVGTVANSCSTMHKITEKEFTLDNFSHEQLSLIHERFRLSKDDEGFIKNSEEVLSMMCTVLNYYRLAYLKTKDKTYWWQIIQLLPSSYNQLRTVQLNYEVLSNIYHSRRGHKLDEWVEFCKMIETLPYSEIITLKEEN